jgi:transcriptional regulator with XRE-family HTH domain
VSPQPEPWIIDQRIQIGSRLRGLREWRNLSQEDLGHAAGTSAHSVYRAENGKTALNLDHLMLYARELGAPLIWFFNDEPLPPAGP